MLKYLNQFLPGSVYTSGNTSSAAGLTVSIAKDSDLKVSVIEPGALMLADRGMFIYTLTSNSSSWFKCYSREEKDTD